MGEEARKIEEFNRLILGDKSTSYVVEHGDGHITKFAMSFQMKTRFCLMEAQSVLLGPWRIL